MDLLQNVIEILFDSALFLCVIMLVAQFVIRRWNQQSLSRLLSEHFGRKVLSKLTISERLFPVAIRVELQRAIEEFLLSTDVRNALEEMLVSGGSLNLKLLGADSS